MKNSHHFLTKLFLCLPLVFTLAVGAHAGVTTAAWYRLGENDPPSPWPSPFVATTTSDLLGIENLNVQIGDEIPLYTPGVSSGASTHVGSSLAVRFEATSSYRNNAVVSTAVENFGIEAWVRPDTGTYSDPRVAHFIAYNGRSSYDGWGIYLKGSHYYGLLGHVAALDSGTAAVAGTWAHVALVCAGGTTTLYVNGMAVASTNATPIAPSGAVINGGFTIGNIIGAIDEVRVFTFGAGQFSINDLLLNQQLQQGVTTLGVTTLTPASVGLAGAANAAGLPTSAWFEWGTNMVSGAIPAYGNMTPPQSFDGSADGPNFGQNLTGLAGGVTYQFRAAASNSLGLVLGANESFTVPLHENLLINGGFETPFIIPSSTTGYVYRTGTQLDGWSIITSQRGVAQLDGRYHPVANGGQALQIETLGDTISQTFQTVPGGSYLLEFDLAAYDGAGSHVGVVVGPVAANFDASGTGYVRHAVPFIADASGVTTLAFQKKGPATTYPHLDNVTVTSGASIATLAASAIGAGSATLNGIANPQGMAATVWFEWSTSPLVNHVTPPQTLGSGTSDRTFSVMITGLTPSTTYSFHAVASNSAGLFVGTNQSFTTRGPTVSTLPATALTASNATLNGLANPHGANTSAYFEWGLTTNYGNLTPPQILGSGANDLNFRQGLVDLLPGLTLHFRAIASNEFGVLMGANQIFQTIPPLFPDLAIPGIVIATIEPPEAVADGARWTLDGGPAQPSGIPEPGVAPGKHTLRFGNLPNWRRPQAVEVFVMGGKTSQVAGVFTRIPTFDVQQVPEQSARTNETVAFFVNAGASTAQLQVAATPPPVGAITFDAATGRFTYTPAAADRLPFTLTFSIGGVQIGQTTITPRPNLPSEEIVINYDRELPDDESRDYITITESQNAPELFNDASNPTLSVDISGKKLVFESGHRANLHPQYSGRDNIKEFRLFADVVIIRSPLLLPQTHVTIHARELRFEGGGLIDTTPKARMLQPTGVVWGDNLTSGLAGDAGHPGGDVEVLVERFHADPTPSVRFILRGGAGGPAGDGRDGVAEAIITNRVDWTNMMTRAGNVICDQSSSGLLLYSEYWFNNVLKETCGSRVAARGEPAVVSGEPGRGGVGGTLRSTLNLGRYADLSGGSAGARGPNHVGGTLFSQFAYKTERTVVDQFGHTTTTVSYTIAPKVAGWDAAAPFGVAGDPGSVEVIPDPGVWLHSFALRSIVQFAKDAYLTGHDAEMRALLGEYRDTLHALQPVVASDTNPSDAVLAESTSLDQLTLEMDTLLHRIDSNLDFFGNPAGWVPMLSFEANKIAFDNEIEHSMPILYLAYWLNHAATNQQDSLAASQVAVGKLTEELGEMTVAYNEAQKAIPQLKIKSDTIRTNIAYLQVKLATLQHDLLARAQQNVEDLHKVPLWKKGIGVLAFVAEVCPYYQPTLGKIGNALEQLEKLDPAKPLESAKAIVPKAFAAYSEKSTNITFCLGNSNSSTNTAGTNSVKKATLKELSQCGKFLGGELKELAAVFKDVQVDSKEVQAELDKLKAADPVFVETVTDLEQLNKDKAGFAQELAAALQAVSILASGITENELATDNLQDRIANALTTLALDHSALLHVKEMERRAKDRLLKFQYFVAKSFQYRTLQGYQGNLQLNRLFGQFQDMIERGNSHELSAQDFDNLKAIYKGELADIAFQAMAPFEVNAPERSQPASFALTANELEKLNRERRLVINLRDKGFFDLGYENIRIADLHSSRLNVRPVGGSVSGHALLTVDFVHQGVSRLTSGGQTFLFRHYQTEVDNPIAWNTVWDGIANTVNNSVLSPAAESLIRTLLDQPNNEKLLLFSRPAADAEILITKTVSTANGIDLVINDLQVEVQYEFFNTSPSRSELTVKVTDGLQPIITVDPPDVNERRDGQGGFRRIFQAGAVVTLQAPARYGARPFDRWVVNNQSGPAGVTTVNLTLARATTAEARFAAAPTSGTTLAIVQQPQGASAPLGSTASFSVAATGSGPLTFFWQKNGAPLIDGGHIAGATTGTLLITEVGLADGGSYSVVVSNSFGTSVSSAALLTVTAPSPSLVRTAPGSVGFQFPTIVGMRYVIEQKVRLQDPQWTVVTVMTGTGGLMQLSRPTSAGSSFLRLRVDQSAP